MVAAAPPAATTYLPREALEDLVRALRADGREVIAPTVRDGVVDYAAIDHASDLPFGWRDQFPQVCEVSPVLKQKMLQKFAVHFQAK